MTFSLTALLSIFWVQPVSACGAQGGDSRASSGGCVSGAAVHPGAGVVSSTAHPVDIITGNKFYAHRDARLPGGLTLMRFYNSRNDFKGPLGPAWRHGFHAGLAVRERGKAGRPPSAQIVQGDGRRIVLQAAGTGKAVTSPVAVFAALDSAYGTLHRQPSLSADRRWRWQWRDGSRLFFNSTGQLSAVEKANGVRLTLTYSGKPSRLQTVSNRYRQKLKFKYQGPQRQLRQVVLPDGQRVQYLYDANGVLTGVDRDALAQWRFTHSDEWFGAIATVRNALGQVVSQVKYDAEGRANYSSLAGQKDAIYLQYQVPEKTSGIGTTHITIKPNSAARSTYHWRYDPVNQRRAMLNATGAGCSVCPATNIERQYDSASRLIQEQSKGGTQSHWQYDPIGRLITYERYAPSSNSATSPVPAKARSISQGAVETVYDSAQLDAAIKEQRYPSVAPGKQHLVSFTRDSFGRVIAVTETGYEPVGSSLRQRNGQWQIDRWLKISRQWHIVYVDFGPAAGLPASIDGPLPGKVDEIRFVYDQQGRRVIQFGPYRKGYKWTYDANGFVSSLTASAGATHTYGYDRFNRLIQTSKDGVVTKTERNLAGQRTALKTSNKPDVNFELDSMGVLSALRDAQANRLDFAHVIAQALKQSDLASLIGRVPRGSVRPVVALRRARQSHGIQITRKTGGEYIIRLRDDFGRVVAQMDSETGVQRTIYDFADRPTVRVDERHIVEVFRYADDGKFAGISAKSGSWQQRYWRGRLSQRKERYQDIRYKYDKQRRLIETRTQYQDKISGEKFAKPLKLGRTYGEHGHLATRDIGHGWQLQYQWRKTQELDAVQLVKKTDANNTVVMPIASQFEWQPFTGGQTGLLAAKLGNSIRTNITLDKQMRVTAINHVRGDNRLNVKSGALTSAKTLPVVSRTYNVAGRVSSQTVADTQFQYRYDKRGWLTGYESAVGSETWQYRADGTRRGAGQPSSKKKQNPAGKDDGLVTAPTGALAQLDRAGRPRFSITKQRNVYRYLYNINGERIAKIRIDKPKKTRWFIYENKRLQMETDAVGNPTKVFVRIDDRPIAIIEFKNQEPTIQWVHTDPVGQPVALTDSNAQVTWQGLFNPFGQFISTLTSPKPPASFPLRLPGQYHDLETGYHDNYRRTYNPSTGSYLGPDPLGLRPTGLRYAYANNSPLDTIDPLGLYERDMHYYATFVIAMAAGMTYEEARVVANANQHVDDHSSTEPMINGGQTIGDLVNSARTNIESLAAFHFAMDTRVLNPDGTISYRTSRDPTISNPVSPRLEVIRQWVNNAPNRRASLFRLGVYSHTYMDTAAHRDANNMPIPAGIVVPGIDQELAIGHGPHLHTPDYTYNTCEDVFGDGEVPVEDPDHSSNISNWPNNESRTLTIQEDVFRIYQRQSNRSPRVSWERLSEVLARFNATRENEQGGSTDGERYPTKLEILEEFLASIGARVNDSNGLIVFVTREDRIQNSGYIEVDAGRQWESMSLPVPQLEADTDEATN